MIKTMKITPSSAAFMMGDLVCTEYAHGCLRATLAAAYGCKDPSEIADVNQRVGATHESWYSRNLSAEVFGAEVPIKGEILGVPFSGRADFITDHGNFRVVHETKGSVSDSTRKSVIKGGKFKLNWLAQLVFYMSRVSVVRGKIVAGFYEEAPGNLFKHIDGREFKVEVQDSGAIDVDGVFCGYTIQDQLAHQTATAKVLTEDLIWDRPDGAEKSWGSPCHFCHLKATCLEYDLGSINNIQEFVDHFKGEKG